MKSGSIFLRNLCGGDLPPPLSARIRINPYLLSRLIKSEAEAEVQFPLRGLISNLWEIEPLMDIGSLLSRDGINFLQWCRESETTVTLTYPPDEISSEKAKVLVDCSVHRLTLPLDNIPSGGREERRAWESITRVVSKLRVTQQQQAKNLPLLSLLVRGTETSMGGLVKVIRQAARLSIDDIVVLPDNGYPGKAFREASSLARELGVTLHWGGLIPADPCLSDGAGINTHSDGESVKSELLPPGEGVSSSDSIKQWIKKLVYRVISADAKVDLSGLKPTPRRRKFCLFPWNWIYIDKEGRVTPCPISSRIMGDYKKQTLSAVWNGDAYQDFRARLLSPYPMEECRGCTLRDWFTPWEIIDWIWTGVNDQFGVQLGVGWYEREIGLPYRWSRREASFRLKNSGKKKLSLVFHLPGKKLAQYGDILINNQKSGEFRLKKRGDTIFSFPVPPLAGEELVVKIVSRSPIIPDHILFNNDWRSLGVAFKGAFLR